MFNVVHGDKVAVDRILEHPDIATVSFVVSAPIARYIYETGTRNGKRCALGGAKNHMVVLPDADVEMAADAAVSARGYGSAGERCMAISVVVVAVGHVADPLVEAIKARLSNFASAPDAEPDGDPPRAPRRGGRLRRCARPLAATVVVDGRQHEVSGNGFFLGASLLDDVGEDMDCYRDEIFGSSSGHGGHVRGGAAPGQREPVRQRHGDLHPEQGTPVPVRLQCRHGRHQRAHPRAVSYYSFGGWKASLLGDLHGVQPDGIRSTTRTKVVTSRWPEPRSTSSVDLAPAGSLRPVGSRVERGDEVDLGVVLQTSAWRVVDLAKRADRVCASATSGRSTRTSCGRSRTSSSARSWPRPAR